jgi:DNA-binding NtrC family response regulator
MRCAKLPQVGVQQMEASGNRRGRKPAGTRRRRVLLVEPDTLTRWSIGQYLGRWFIVEKAPDGPSAEALLARRSFAALMVSDQIPPEHLERIQCLAGRRNPAVRIVRMVSGETELRELQVDSLALEKPFALSALARLLGVPEAQLSTS